MALRGIHIGREGGPLGFRAEHLNVCIREVKRQKYPKPRQWDKLVSVAKLAFREERILLALACTTMVLTPKGVG